jgi:hypothetical protein
MCPPPVLEVRRRIFCGSIIKNLCPLYYKGVLRCPLSAEKR